MTDSRINILMVGPQVPAYADALERAFSVHKLWLAEDRQAFLTERADVIRGIATNAPVGADKALIDALPNLEIISSLGVGLDAIDLPAARERQVIVTNTPAVLDDCVADAGMMLLLAVARRLGEAERFVRAGKWLSGKFPLATSLKGKTCGVLGMGNIGKAFAERAQAFGMRIAYSTPTAKNDLPYVYFADPLELARQSDFLVLALPGGSHTHHIVDAKMLEALGPTGFLINIARGSVVDQAALISALQNGMIAGAGLDVFEDEPRVPEALLKLENVVLTPHIASGTNETRKAMSDLAFGNLDAHFSGRPVLTQVI